MNYPEKQIRQNRGGRDVIYKVCYPCYAEQFFCRVLRVIGGVVYTLRAGLCRRSNFIYCRVVLLRKILKCCILLFLNCVVKGVQQSAGISADFFFVLLLQIERSYLIVIYFVQFAFDFGHKIRLLSAQLVDRCEQQCHLTLVLGFLYAVLTHC